MTDLALVSSAPTGASPAAASLTVSLIYPMVWNPSIKWFTSRFVRKSGRCSLVGGEDFKYCSWKVIMDEAIKFSLSNSLSQKSSGFSAIRL